MEKISRECKIYCGIDLALVIRYDLSKAKNLTVANTFQGIMYSTGDVLSPEVRMSLR